MSSPLSRRWLVRARVLTLLACVVDPHVSVISQLGAFRCADVDCTQRGAIFDGSPPHTGRFLVAAWFNGTQDVRWNIRWATDSVHFAFVHVRDSSLTGAQLDGMPLNALIVLTVSLASGARDSLTWDYR